MSYEEPLSKHAVAISISESPDMSVLGLGPEHLVDAMAEVARHLLAMGARLMYGGDLRPGGFTEVLFELVARYRRDADLGDERVGVANFLAWPVHLSFTPEEIRRLSDGLNGVADVIFLSADGKLISTADRQRLPAREPSPDEWVSGLTAMRDVMTKRSDARVVLGGKVSDFKGIMPGVAEEALTTINAGKPLYLLGGFGGCARDIAEDLGLTKMRSQMRNPWLGRGAFATLTAENLRNGLNMEENTILATTQHVDQAITLVLRGLLRSKAGGTSTEGIN
jgi:hypothetical protein